MSYNGGEEWEVSSREWSIKNSLRYPTRCHGLFGLLLPLLLFIEPQPLGFVGEEVVFCICAALPPPHPCVFSQGKAAASPVITGCVFELSGVLCVYTRLFSHSKAACLPACLLSLDVCVAEERHWLVSLLSRALPWPCLSVCLPVCFSLPACLSVFLCHLVAAVWRASWCLSCCRVSKWHWFGAHGRDKFTHSHY